MKCVFCGEKIDGRWSCSSCFEFWVLEPLIQLMKNRKEQVHCHFCGRKYEKEKEYNFCSTCFERLKRAKVVKTESDLKNLLASLEKEVNKILKDENEDVSVL